MNLRVSAQRAGWSIREASWGLEERVLWRGSDATREAVDRASRATAPLQKLIQTRVTWPLSDAFRARGRKARAAIVVSSAALAIGAAGAGAVLAGNPSSADRAATASVAAVRTAAPSAQPVVLQGVTPQFQPGHAAVPPQPPAKPSTPAAEVAWSFAAAFVDYEVGRSDKQTTRVFADTATKPLAKALASDPPRLPAKGKVPRARVLNVVMGSATKKQVTASVSLVRLRAISELRLTLTKTGDEWRVAQVLG